MKCFSLLLACVFFTSSLWAQYVYTISADSTKLTGCDSNELIIENHTQGVNGFLYNKGKGRTEFRPGLVRLTDSQYLVGADTLNLNDALKSLTANNGVMRTSNTFQFGNNDDDPYSGPATQIRNTHYFQNGQNFNWMTGYSAMLNISDATPITEETDNLVGYHLVRITGQQAGVLMEGNVQNYFEAPLNWITFKNLTPNAVNYTWYGDAMVAQISTVTRQGSDGKAYAALQFQVANDTANGNTNNNTMAMIIYPSVACDALVPIKVPTVGMKRLYISDYNDIWVGNELTSAQDNPNSRMVVNARNYPIVFANLPQAAPDTVNNKPLVINPATGAIQYSNWSGNSLGLSPSVIPSSLAVNGTITAQRLKLTTNDWPDYVFDPGYQLPTLEYVKQYIARHRHLPGIISATEADNKEIDVADNQKALLKKIEELTLYTIKQNEEMDAMKTEIAELKKMIMGKPGK